jgi:hypothetical protein
MGISAHLQRLGRPKVRSRLILSHTCASYFVFGNLRRVLHADLNVCFVCLALPLHNDSLDRGLPDHSVALGQ